MPTRLAVLLVLLPCLGAGADVPGMRYGVAPDLRSYPQGTPKETLASVLKCADLKRFDYLLAQLADPDWVEARVEVSAGGFKDVVKEAGERLDAPAVKQLKRFLDEGEIETLDTSAVVRLKTDKARVVRLRKIEKRWYLMHANRP
jgi:hypothetical protein